MHNEIIPSEVNTLTTYIFVGGSGVIGRPIVEHFYNLGHDLCVVDRIDPNTVGLHDIPYHRADLLEDPIEEILPARIMENSDVVVLNLAMVRTPKNGGAASDPEWNELSLSKDPLLAKRVAQACCVYHEHVLALYYISTLSIFEIHEHISQRIIMPEHAEDGILSKTGYGIGKFQGEKETEKVLKYGLGSAGIIRLIAPTSQRDANMDLIVSGKAYYLFDIDCKHYIERILTQITHPTGFSEYQLESLEPSNVETTNARRLGCRPSIVWK